MTELGEEILAPLRRSPDAQPNAETLLELRRIQRAAHSLQVEKVALNQENEIMVCARCFRSTCTHRCTP